MLNPTQILLHLTNAFPDIIFAPHFDGPSALHPSISIAPASWLPVAQHLRDDPQLSFTLLRSITGLDYPDKKLLVAAYDLMSFDHHHEICIKIPVTRDKTGGGVIPSAAHLWHAADWHERETYDLLGINFSNHPDSVTDLSGTHPRRILLPDDWLGHPLRKNYSFPREYHGIPGSVELDWQQKTNYPK